ncbi:uncharacterized protein KD926_004367 [Aspergillus affinis]|uniref:uncharacterized protein n=1 Tax=Aspergillus affinis TaxID=1070780 RepID=UPI0022FEB9E5|nr:uncharacterized protein KD926_004367 [Aspergillus affinis]KAI9043184.1 hypothetical protein KD926_004367 [Aspergillus affinis]
MGRSQLWTFLNGREKFDGTLQIKKTIRLLNFEYIEAILINLNFNYDSIVFHHGQKSPLLAAGYWWLADTTPSGHGSLDSFQGRCQLRPVAYCANLLRTTSICASEATFISPKAGGYPNVPGIWNSEQITAWKAVTDEVHKKGSVVFLQLWALGRVAMTEAAKAEGFDVASSSATIASQLHEP